MLFYFFQFSSQGWLITQLFGLRSYLNKRKEKESFIFRFSVLPTCLQAKEKIGKLSPPPPSPPANRRITMPRPVPSNCNRRVPFNKDIVQGHKGRGFNNRF